MTRARTLLLTLAACALPALAVPAPALAATPVDLRDHPESHGATIVLGDLFDGAGAAASAVIGEAAPAGDETVLEAGRVQTAARRAGLDWANALGRRRIVVASFAGPRPSAAGRAHAGRGRGGVLAYARSLNAGEIVQPSDLVWSDEAVAPSDAPSDADAAIGRAARRPLREGSAVAARDLASPRVIRQGDLVSVAFEDEGIVLTLQAKAQGDAAVGENVTVQNVQSKKLLETVASGPGQALVGPAADRLRRAAFDPALRLAAR